MVSVVRTVVLLTAASLLTFSLPATAAVDATPAEVQVAAGSVSPPVLVTITLDNRSDAPTGVLQFRGLPAGVGTIPSVVAYSIAGAVPVGTTSFEFDVSSSTPPGSYPIDITASSTGGVDTVILTVRAPGDVTVLFASPVMTFCAGAAPTLSSVTLTPVGSYSGTPLVQWTVVPADVTVTPLSQLSPLLPPSRTLPFAVSALPGASGLRALTLTVSDAANGIQKSATLTLQITAPSFAASVAPAAVTLTGGGAPAGISASIVANECLRDAVTVRATSLPPGLTFSPDTGSMSPPYAPLTFSVSASRSAPPGTSTVQIEFASAGGVTRSAAVTITVLEPPDFQIAAAPSALTIAAGETAPTQVSLTPLHAFTGAATVTAIADPDVKVTPSSFSVAASSPQTLEISVSPTASPHTAVVTLQAQAPGIDGVRTATVTVNVSPRPDFVLTVSPPAVSVRAGSSTSVVVQAHPMNGFADRIAVTAPSIEGVSFLPQNFVLGPGASQTVQIDATNASPSSPLDLLFHGVASGLEPKTARLLLTILAPDPRLVSITPPATVPGVVEQRFRVTAEFLQPGAVFAFDDSRLRVVASTLLSPRLADLVVTTHADTPPGAHLLRVTNPDGGRSLTGIPLLVYPQTSLAAPLGVTAAAIVFPADGSSVANEESVYPRGLLATSGAGTIIGSWQLDGVPFDRFTAIVTGGLPVEVRAHVPIPTTFAGGHQLQLVIETPAQLAAPAIHVVQTTLRASRLTLFAPRDGAVLAATPQLFRWSLVPNCGGYVVEVIDEAAARAGAPPELLPIRRFRVSAPEWRPSTEDVEQIGFGIRRWRVSPVCAGDTVAEPTPWRRFAFLPDQVSLTIAPIVRDANGKVVLRWTGAPAGLLYLVEVRAADGSVVHAALTPRAEYVLDPQRVPLPQGGSVRVSVVKPGGAVLTGGERELPVPQARGSSIHLAQLTSISNVQTEPANGSRVATTNPRIAANWREPLRPDQVSLMLDATDVTFVATVTPTSIVYDSLLPLEDGPHTVRLSLAAQITTWTFTVAQQAVPSAPGEGAALPAAQTSSKTTLRNEWAISPVGSVTLVRDQNDEGRLRVSAQTDLAGASSSMKVTGDVGLKHEIDDPKRTIQESRSWVTQFGAQQGTFGEELTVGYTQPDFMDQAQLVSAGLARGGAQARIKSRAGTLSYYQTFGTRPVGVVSGNIGPEQTLRAIALQLPPLAKWDFRIIALGVEDEPGPNTSGGEGRALGIFSRYTFGPAVSVIFEAARGRFEPNPGSAVAEREGNAFRISLNGVAAGTSYVLNLRRTESDFVNPANRGFTAGGIPDRTGGDLVVSRLFGATALSAQLRYLRDGTSSGQLLPSTSERGGVVTLTTMLGAHVSFSLLGNRTEQKGDATPALSLPETDRRQSGASATLSETLGVFSTSQTFLWQKMDDAVSELASQKLKAATVTAAGAFHPNFNLSVVLSGTRSEGAPSIGKTDQVLASLQPMINIPSIWISLQPRAMWGRTNSSLTGFETKTEQYAALLTLAPPIGQSVLALQISADWSRNRFTGQIVDPAFTRRYAATVSLARTLGNLKTPSAAPGTIPFLAPTDPRSGLTSSPVTGGVR